MSRRQSRPTQVPGVVLSEGHDGGKRLRIESAARSDTGVQRQENEDAFIIDDERMLYLVCDGMGGHASGKVASELAVRVVAGFIAENSTSGSDDELLCAALQRANRAVLARAGTDEAYYRMGTTAVGIRIEGGTAHICHCGDSRCYRFRNDGLEQLTRDHSLANLYADKPELKNKLGPAQSNVIVRAIGLEESVEIDWQRQMIRAGDIYLLCCDGLTDLVADETIATILRSESNLDRAADLLIRYANAHGGTDNITVILIRARSLERTDDECDGDATVDDFADGESTMPGF